ncbi:MAG: ATPase, T2SS/T4P/T4SS family [Candidatus Helarchaeota archaeon]
MKLDQYFKLEKKIINNNEGSHSVSYLLCECLGCNYLIEEKPLFENQNCLSHIFKILKSVDDKKFNEIHISTPLKHYIINKDQVKILKDFSDHVNKLTLNVENKNNLISNFECNEFKNCKKKITTFIKYVIGQNTDNGILFKTPIYSYKEIKLELSLYSDENIEYKCQKCLKEYIKLLKSILDDLEDTTFIKKYMELSPKIKKMSEAEIINHIIGHLNVSLDESSLNNKIKNATGILEKYTLGPFNITLYESDEFIENLYQIDWAYISDELKIISNWVLNELNKWEINEFNKRFLKFDELLELKINRIKKILAENSINIDPLNENKFIYQIVFKSVGFPLLFAFLIDDKIEEIFLDRLNSPIYLDHREFGRCRSNVYISKDDLQKFITRVRMDSNLQFDEMNPSIKADIITKFFQIRVTIIQKPLSSDDIIVIIRKIRKKIYSILELIDNGTISIEAASYLIFNLFHKRNIVVIGAPGSGKTTLINSLDILTPDHWRKIYIEDVIESIDQKDISKHQIRISTKNFAGDLKNNTSKAFQVRESLHRTPDMIYLGEMISKNSISAFFFLLKVGLRCGLCTSHGEDPELMIKRWMIEDGISINSVQDIDIIVQISKINDVNQIKRRVIRISEIKFDDTNNFKLVDIFKRNSKLDILNMTFSSWNEVYEQSPVIQKIHNSRVEDLDFTVFNTELNILKNIISHLLENHKLNNKTINFYINKYWQLYKKIGISDPMEVLSLLFPKIHSK